MPLSRRWTGRGIGGCGAFGNDPHRTAAGFRRHLDELAGSFEHVVFAIADWSQERRFLRPFADAFETGASDGRRSRASIT